MEIDFKGFEEYLDARSNIKAFITQETIVNPSDIQKIRELIKKYKKSNVIQCIRFLGNPNDPENKFVMKVACDYCSNTIVGKFTRTDILKYIDGCKFICPICNEKAKQMVTEKKLVESKLDAIKKEDRTKEFIETYLQPNDGSCSSFGMGTKLKEMNRGYISVNSETIKEYIIKMRYRDFLNTRYWMIIADYKKHCADRKCQLCGSSTSVNVHHKTYEHHGIEIDYYKEDLIVLCKNCHEKFHDICKEGE